MNNINVPKEYKHMLRKEHPGIDNDARDIEIRRLIEARKNMVITLDDFNQATGVSSAIIHVQRLMRAGKITRKKIKPIGQRSGWAYRWHEDPLLPKDAVLKNGGVVTTKINLPLPKFTESELTKLTDAFHEWIFAAMPDGEDITAVRRFILRLKDDNAKVIRERMRILEGKDAKQAGSTDQGDQSDIE